MDRIDQPSVAEAPVARDVASQECQRVIEAFCPRFHYAVELVGKRWSGAILRAMLAGVVRFSDLAGAVPGLSDRLLSERLRELEAAGIIVRQVYPETPVRIEYRLTDMGRALEPAITALAHWAETWLPAVDDASPAALPEAATTS